MIITVTPNPCIDKTARLGAIEIGELNRLDGVTLDYSGKGANVSKNIKMLGGDTIATGLLGENGSSGFIAELDERKIAHRFVRVCGEIRVNLKIIDGQGHLTELNERGIHCGEEDWLRLEKCLCELAGPNALFVLSGSLPPGAGSGSYLRLCNLLKAAKAKVLVDADGEAFSRAIEAPPDYVKPNRFELLQYFGAGGETSGKGELPDLYVMCRKLIKKGIKTVTLSMGGDGAMFVNAHQGLYAPALPVKVESPVGAGDSMAAALAVSIQRGYTLRETAILAMAASSASVTVEGTRPPCAALVEQLKAQVLLAQME